jgi:hypothetical protein
MPISLLAILAFFIRKELVVGLVAFIAGGILTLKYPIVESYMNKAEKVFNEIIVPDFNETKDKVERIIDNNVKL